MSRPPTAPAPTIVPTNSAKGSANQPAIQPAKGSASDSEPSLTKGEKHIRVLVGELYRSGISQETIETITGVPQRTISNWCRKVMVDKVLTPRVTKFCEQISPRVERGGDPSSWLSNHYGTTSDNGLQEPQGKTERTNCYLPKK
jgi:hypothetical protein